MSMRGHCRCNNIELVWQTVDHSIVPRACQCDYCRAKGAAYVSKSGTSVAVRIRTEALHRIVRQGSETAQFHECGGCGDIVLVTAEIDGVLFGALNAGCLQNKLGFCAAQETHFVAQTKAEKQERWRQNWCSPVVFS